MKRRKRGICSKCNSKNWKRGKKNEICINNFKINLNKGVSKFENYDTIITSQKVKLFSNFYLPIEIKKVTNIELVNQPKTYSEEELKEK